MYDYFQQMPYTANYQVTRVNGENGANAFRMPANSSVLLLDETAPIVWLAQTDGAGYKTLTAFKIEPFTKEPDIDLRDVVSRIERLEERINEQKSDVGPSKRKQTTITE